MDTQTLAEKAQAIIAKYHYPKNEITPVYVGLEHAGKHWRIHPPGQPDNIVAAGYVNKHGRLQLYDALLLDDGKPTPSLKEVLAQL